MTWTFIQIGLSHINYWFTHYVTLIKIVLPRSYRFTKFLYCLLDVLSRTVDAGSKRGYGKSSAIVWYDKGFGWQQASLSWTLCEYYLYRSIVVSEVVSLLADGKKTLQN